MISFHANPDLILTLKTWDWRLCTWPQRYEDPPDGCDELKCPADCEHADFTFETAERDFGYHEDFCTKDMEISGKERDILCGHYVEKFSFLGQGAEWW